MNVGILGSGEVGEALGRGFVSLRFPVMLGSRSPKSERLQEFLKEARGRAYTGSFKEAADFGEIVLLATMGAATEEVVGQVGPKSFEGKLVIDVTNPLSFQEGAPPGLFVGTTDSLGERVQRLLPRAKVVKCFNTVPSMQFFNPTVKDAEMLICGDDKAAKGQVVTILKQFGWRGAIDVGGIGGARWLEAMVPLWSRVGETLGVWDHIFTVARR